MFLVLRLREMANVSLYTSPELVYACVVYAVGIGNMFQVLHSALHCTNEIASVKKKY